MFDMSPGFGVMSALFPIFFIVIFAIIATVIIFAIVKSISTGLKNNASPMLTVAARVVGKRTETSGGAGDTSASTWYYATFEVASGDRMEFTIDGRESGMLAEGDTGSLTFQGTRYHSFTRDMHPSMSTR